MELAWKPHILDQALWKSSIRKKGLVWISVDNVVDGVMYIVYAHRTCPWEMWSWSKWEIGLGEGTSHPLLLRGLWAGMRSRDTGLTSITFRLMNCRPQPTSAFLALSPQMLRLRDPAALHYWTMAIMQDLINTHWFFLTSLHLLKLRSSKIDCIWRAYWRWNHKYQLPKYCGITPMLQVCFTTIDREVLIFELQLTAGSMLFFYLINYNSLQHHRNKKYHW